MIELVGSGILQRITNTAKSPDHVQVIGAFLRCKLLRSFPGKHPCLPARPEPELQRWVYPTDGRSVQIGQLSECNVGNFRRP